MTATQVIRTWRPRLIGLADQVLSSVGNVLAVVLIARSVSADEFGRFSLMYTVLILVLAVSRSFFGVRISLAQSADEARTVTSRLTGSLVLLALPLALIVALTGLFLVPGGDPALLAVMAVATPVVCIQDALRFGAVASGRPSAAFLSDLVWVAIIGAAFLYSGDMTPSLVISIWLGAATVALATASLAMWIGPDIRGGLGDLRTRFLVGESRAFGAAVTFGSNLVVVTAAAYLVAEAAAGSLRGASTLMGPVNVLLAYLHLVVTPVVARMSRRDIVRACALLATGMTVIVGMWGAVLLLVPTAWGEIALGATWRGTRAVLPYTVVEYLLIGLTTPAVIGLTVRGEARRLFQQKLVMSVVTVLAGIVVLLLWRTAEAAAAAFAFAALLSAVIAWQALRDPEGQPEERPDPAAA